MRPVPLPSPSASSTCRRKCRRARPLQQTPRRHRHAVPCRPPAPGPHQGVGAEKPAALAPCRDSRRRLDQLLRDWAGWHADRYLPGYVPPLVESGAVTYAPDQMHLGVSGGGSGAAVWEDRPAPPGKAPAETLWFNISYEKVGLGMAGSGWVRASLLAAGRAAPSACLPPAAGWRCLGSHPRSTGSAPADHPAAPPRFVF